MPSKATYGAVAAVVVVGAAAAWWYHGKGAPDQAHAAESPAAAGPRGAASGQQFATLVTLATAKKQDVPVTVTVNGMVVSLNSVDVRPQVSNMVQKVHVKEGDFVKAGQPLFTLDSRADQANLEKAKAQMLKDQAQLADLERQYQRSQELLAQNFVAKGATDTVLSQVEAQRAAVEADKAAIQSASVQMTYDEIRAPISGRTGVINAFVGTLAQPGNALVTITQLDPIAVQFPVPEGRLQDLLDASRQHTQVLATVPGRPAALKGFLSFVDNTVDPTAGTVRAKATFDNADHALWPGQYVNASVTVRQLKDAVVVPIAAVITSPNGRIVYVLKDDMTVQPRRVEIVYSFGDQAVLSALQVGERVVVEGKQNLRPGSRVRLERAPQPGGGMVPGSPGPVAKKDPT
ncbi:efflux RND transporter periplasmic adaptor subunit [Ramlibacter sp. G-1-2-2]|uniref:Efflux RND transporter periplasmic adaptor subunit n=1 Tax=Ramlibacter agri TaxID=2728837 RepID=A0A848H4M8_9BURK|nr:efflux RND transporter periplasmic adaptor subunit [Ramlibacter agri]NML45514.1 efflux RND transporter periplasmic adaptor subunit [Ramlibacter agri]